MNHIEGGWPAEVKVQFIEYRNKFIRKIVKEEMFVFTITKVWQDFKWIRFVMKTYLADKEDREVA